jgi:ubiquinone/menaquinone biosynthesis C-methylase UbiE
VPQNSFGSVEMASAYDELSDPQFTHGKTLIALLGIGPGDRVLDIGCGTGRLAAFAVERMGVDGRVVGIDPASPRIQVAQERADPRLEFRISEAQELSPFPDGSFDVAYLNSVFNWIRDKPRAFSEAHRVLKSGGRLGVGTTVQERPNQLGLIKSRAWKTVRGVSGRTEQDTSRASGKIGSNYVATAAEIRAMLEDAGFVPRIHEVRTFISMCRDVAHIVDFLQATSYGDLAPGASAADYAAFRRELEALFAGEYADCVSSDGIRLERYVLLAVADKPK